MIRILTAALLTKLMLPSSANALEIQCGADRGNTNPNPLSQDSRNLPINIADGTLSLYNPSGNVSALSLIDVAPVASRYATDAYASGTGTGFAGLSVINSDASARSGKERYGAFFAYTGPGTGDPSVIGSAFGLGAAGLKKNWQTSKVPGQSVGINITARGGYHGSDANAALSQFGGYNPAGDTSSIIANSFVSSAYSQNAILEGVSYYGEGGAFSAAGQLHGINVQLGAMRMLNPDGSTANPGIGLALAAKAGALGYAIQANNAARPGSYEVAPSTWAGFLRYNFDDGTRPPFDAFRVDQDGSIVLNSGSGTTPQKRIRVASNGNLQILNNAEHVILEIDNNGLINLTNSAQLYIKGQPVVGPRQAAISDRLSEGAKIAAILGTLRAHGLIASQ